MKNNLFSKNAAKSDRELETLIKRSKTTVHNDIIKKDFLSKTKRSWGSRSSQQVFIDKCIGYLRGKVVQHVKFKNI